MTSIFEGQPPKTRPFPIKTRVIWVPGLFENFPRQASNLPAAVQAWCLLNMEQTPQNFGCQNCSVDAPKIFGVGKISLQKNGDKFFPQIMKECTTNHQVFQWMFG